MASIGYGYGSEWNLLRFMGRHRKLLERTILDSAALEGRVEWLDFDLVVDGRWLDIELTGLKFLSQEHLAVQEEFRRSWPQTGTPVTWDAVAWLEKSDQNRELLLFEAKAHLGELTSDGTKAGTHSRERINQALNTVKTELEVDHTADWLGKYYQHANRLFILSLTNKLGLPSRLVNLYFINDRFYQCRDGVESERTDINIARSESDWKNAIEERRRTLKLPERHRLSDRVHNVFINLRGTTQTR